MIISKYSRLFTIALLASALSLSCTKDELEVEQPLDQGQANGEQPSAPSSEEDLADQQNQFTPRRIHFDFDRYIIKSEFETNLQEIAAYLQENNKNLTIEGHCDNRGTTNYNIFLGNRRAESAKDYLTKLGIKEDRIKVVSFGEEYPLSQDGNSKSHALNRRAEFIIR